MRPCISIFLPLPASISRETGANPIPAKRLFGKITLAFGLPIPKPHCGAATRSRTLDLLITSELLYQLSYGGQNGGGILKNEIVQRNHHIGLSGAFREKFGRKETSPPTIVEIPPASSNKIPPF
jgi:hypothetical protein